MVGPKRACVCATGRFTAFCTGLLVGGLMGAVFAWLTIFFTEAP